MSSLIIRKALAADIPLLQSFIFLHGQNPWNYLPEAEVKYHLSLIATGQVYAFIAEVNNQCVGFASFNQGLPEHIRHYEKMPDTVAYLAEIVVHQENTGQGIGIKLIDAIKSDLVAILGTKKLYALRHANNLASAGVMKKAGFKIVDEFYDTGHRSTGSQRTAVTCLEI